MPGGYVNVLFCLVVVGAGVSVAFQQVLNTNLRTELDSPWWAGFISYLVGTIVMLAAATTSDQPWLSAAMVARTSFISWAGGIFGAIFIGTAILMVPRLGAATVLALIVVGQMIGSLAFDHFGVLGIPQHSANPVRLAGAALLVLGVTLVRF
ncbi:DMT family transporter [Bradyrhizobium neotropicale]|uniref:DMT family transporter n=1 Tax=Bradyrhizobium neotropicale TaxID=1497615 RepID=UPI001AD77A79|nr:DMT family transporter [Bradyrhizobium neotropicale]MBO4221862.1 EamA-like transporter family protein [Bradyrhizobium neotropicale]